MARYKIDDSGDRVQVSAQEEERLNAKEKRVHLLDGETGATFESEGAQRVSNQVPSWGADDIGRLRSSAKIVSPVATPEMKNAKAIADYVRETVPAALKQLSSTELDAVDPAADDPFANTPISPGPWPA